jgi:hypothetical protein
MKINIKLEKAIKKLFYLRDHWAVEYYEHRKHSRWGAADVARLELEKYESTLRKLLERNWNMTTICSECQHPVQKGPHRLDWLCGAYKNPEITDYVTGEVVKEINQLCYFRNNGRCKKFEPKLKEESK